MKRVYCSKIVFWSRLAPPNSAALGCCVCFSSLPSQPVMSAAALAALIARPPPGISRLARSGAICTRKRADTLASSRSRLAFSGLMTRVRREASSPASRPSTSRKGR